MHYNKIPIVIDQFDLFGIKQKLKKQKQKQKKKKQQQQQQQQKNPYFEKTRPRSAESLLVYLYELQSWQI